MKTLFRPLLQPKLRGECLRTSP